LIVFSLSMFFAAAPLDAQGKPKTFEEQTKEIADLVTKLDGLVKKLPKPAPPTALDPKEIAELATLVSRVVDPTLAAKTWADDLNVLLTTAKPDLLDDEFRAACMRLVQALSKLKLEERVSLPVVVPPAGEDIHSNTTALLHALEAIRVPGRVPEAADKTKNLNEQKLVELATAISKVLDPTFAITVWANDLALILDDRKPDMNDANLRTALRAVLAALPKLEPPVGPYLNILQAYYGDAYHVTLATTGKQQLDKHTKTGRRVCDATNEVRTACQGKDQCPYAPANGQAMSIGGVKLCGSNIVAQAGGNVAGVRIIYECLTVSKPEWDILERWRRPKNPQDTPLQMWMRQGTATTIRCSADLAP